VDTSDAWELRLLGAPLGGALPLARRSRRGAGGLRRIPLSRHAVDALPTETADRNERVIVATAVLLHRYLAQGDLVIGCGRVGTNGVRPMRIRVTGDEPVAAVVQAVRGERAAIAELEPVPVERLRTVLGIAADDEQMPCHAVVTGPAAAADLIEAADLVVTVTADEVALVVDDRLLSAEAARQYARHLGNVVVALKTEPARPVGQLRLVDDEERALILSGWNDTARPTPTRFFHESVELVAERTPDATAVVHGDERVSYGELDARANRLANHLAGLGVGAAGRIGVCFERGVPSLVSQLAAFKLGATAVLLDPEYPQERLEFMLADAAVSVVVTSTALRQKVTGDHALVSYDTDLWMSSSDSPVRTGVTGNSVCHIAYTSGSTGVPKAVTLRHGPMRTLVHALVAECGITAAARGTWLSSPGFGLVEVDPFPVLAAGGEVHIADAEIAASPTRLRDWLIERRITHALLLTAMAERLWTMPWPADTVLRNVRIAGERVRSWPPADLPFEVINVYGAAEVAVVSTANLAVLGAPLDADERATLLPPVGRPIPNVRTYVLDDALEPVPPGVLGELHVSGADISANYLNRPQAADAKFIANPFPDDPNRILYRTGDAARYWSDGTIEIVGRLDNEVKVNGYRVHLGEIESLIAQQPGVRQTAVLAREDLGTGVRLVAYVEPDAAAPCRPQDLRRVLRAKLPRYMRPAAYVLGDLPTTANGKIDRDALPPPEHTRPELDTTYVPPRDELERLIAGIWQDVLEVDEVGVLDDFFELGGDSMRAVRVIDALRANGNELELSDLLTAPSVAAVARVVERLRRERTEPTRYPTLVHDATARHEPFPLNQSQQALWIGRGNALEYGDVGCHGYFEYEHPNLDVERFRRAWQALLRRHDMLRMVVLPTGDQVILDETPGDGLTVADFSDLTEDEADRRVVEIREHMSHQVLPNDRWPLYDVRLTRLPGGRVRLHFGLDMLITDAWSIYQVLFPDLIDLYDDPDAELPELAVTFRDYVLGKIDAQRDSVEYARSRQYWLDRLSTLPAAPDLPLAANPDRAPKFHRREHEIDAARWDRLKDHAKELGLTPSALLVAVFAEVLRTWAKNDRFTINFPVSDRMALHPQVPDLIGDFTNTLLVAVEKVDGTFAERARDIQEQLWRDLAHRHFNGVDVLREIGRREGGSLRPVMPVVVTSLLGHPARRQSSAFGAETYGISQTPQVTLDFQIREIDGILHYKWDFLDTVFPDGMVDAMFGAYNGLIERLLTDVTAWREDRFDLVPADQLALRAEVNDTAADVPSVLLQEILAARAAQRPDAPVVIAPDRTLSYAELVAHANRIGRGLRERGVVPGRLVGVVMEKGWEQYAAVYGILTAGAAYLPIDAGVPPERLAHLLERGEIDTVLTQRHLATALPWPDGVEPLVVGEVFTELSAEPLEPVQQQTDLAYVIYTSGSTGNPKGVMVDHRGVVNHVLDINRRLDIGAGDRAMATAGLHFDMSVYDVFGIPAAGGAVVLPEPYDSPDPRRWAELVRQENVTFWGAVPALMETVVGGVEQAGGTLDGLRTVVLAGDWIPLTLPDRIRGVAPGARVIGSGGPTETVNWSVIYEIGAVDPRWPSIPYGKPLANHRYYVVDDALRQRPLWATGQMVVASDVGLAHGYWRDAERTAERFFRLPDTGERVYATGDLGRYLPDGNIEILGRDDFQVKINGYRVELGEIEATLNRHPDIGAATVVAPEKAGGGRRLVAFVVPTGELDLADVTAFLTERLPRYLVPADIRVLDAFPLTANGKVDRREMAALAGRHEVADADADGEASALEQIVMACYATALGVDRAGIDSDFFQLGGDSLSGTRLAGQLGELLGVDVGLRAVLTMTTPRALAGAIAADPDTGEIAVGMAEALAELSEEDIEAESDASPAA
jgi:amino acid adenylation domain-containing protein